MSETVLKQILDEIQSLKSQMNNRFDTIETNMSLLERNVATKADVIDITQINQAVIETNLNVKQILDDQKSIHEILGEHEVAIRTLRRKPV